MMRFCFQLTPAEEVLPWGANQPYLNWFALTQGWFWIEVGGVELFRYSNAVLEHWRRLYPDYPPPALPYEDYQIVRYWEDLLDSLPVVLEPVPDDLAARVRDGVRWEAWQETVRVRWEEQNPNDWETSDTALRWWWERRWNAGHLAHPPNLWLWRVGDTLHVRWDNRDVTVDVLPVWEADQGECTLPVTDFLDAVSDFHNRLLAAMDERVNLAQSPSFRPDVTVDRAHLKREQHDRGAWLANALDPHRRQTWSAYSWDEVRAALSTVEQAVPAAPAALSARPLG